VAWGLLIYKYKAELNMTGQAVAAMVEQNVLKQSVSTAIAVLLHVFPVITIIYA